MRRRAVLVGLLAFPLVSRVAAAITVDSEHGAKTQVRMRLSAGGGSQVRTRLGGRVRTPPLTNS